MVHRENHSPGKFSNDKCSVADTINSHVLGCRFSEVKSKSGVPLLLRQNFWVSRRIKFNLLFFGNFQGITIHFRQYQAV